MVAYKQNYLWNKTQETISGGSEQKWHLSFDSFWNFHHKYYLFKPNCDYPRERQWQLGLCSQCWGWGIINGLFWKCSWYDKYVMWGKEKNPEWDLGFWGLSNFKYCQIGSIIVPFL